MKNVLLILPFLAGCGSMLTDSTPIRTEDGSRVYSITSLYGGEPGSREQATKSMDIDARNLCMSGYTLISEEAHPIMDASGGVRSSRLVWEVKCDKKPEATSP
ncbi:MAG: hypothetical protein ACREUM_04365 [Nitrosospira sp.]|jgi:hypothetical protein